MYDRIDHLITIHEFSFQSWLDPYDRGVWAALAPVDVQLDTVRDECSRNDVDAALAAGYVLTPDWLPLVTAPTSADALQALENRLAFLPVDQLAGHSTWAQLVGDGLDELSNAVKHRNRSDERVIDCSPLPQSWIEAVAADAAREKSSP